MGPLKAAGVPPPHSAGCRADASLVANATAGASVMPRACSVCAHAKRNEIDAALVRGEAYRNIAERFRLSVGSLHRHGAEHLPATLTKAAEAAEVAHADTLLDQVRALHKKALSILDKAEGDG